MLFVLGDRVSVFLGQFGPHGGRDPTERDPRGAFGGGRPTPQTQREVRARRVGLGDGDPANHPGLVFQVEQTPVGHARNGEGADPVENFLVPQARMQRRTDVRQRLDLPHPHALL